MTMITDYDPIAEQYRRSKQQPWRGYIESCSLLELIGERGYEVFLLLAVACLSGGVQQTSNETDGKLRSSTSTSSW